VDRLDYRVRRRGQEAIDEMRSGDRFGLGAAVASVFRLDASESGQRPVIVEREPNDVFFLGLQVPGSMSGM
jgi:hypothetical protein